MKIRAIEVDKISSIPTSNTSVVELKLFMTNQQLIEALEFICEELGDDVFEKQCKRIIQE